MWKLWKTQKKLIKYGENDKSFPQETVENCIFINFYCGKLNKYMLKNKKVDYFNF